MKIEGGKMAEKLANYQFTIIGEKTTFADIPEDGMITVGKKKIKWYEYYFFTEEQEKEWREWCKEQIKDYPLPVDLYTIDMVYGFNRKNIKEGEP